MNAEDACILVSAADSRYCGSLLAMLHSLRDINLPLGVLDLGLSEQDRDRIRSVWGRDCQIFDPGWCIALEDQSATPSYKKVFLAKPFLPQLLPGYTRYLWVDADIHFQDTSAINDYIAAADTTGVAIGFEDHPSYRKKGWPALLQRLGIGKKTYKARRMEQYFGTEVARKWSKGATLNSGIFCIRGNCKAWSHWQAAMQKANLSGQNRKRLICDQTCLDLAISQAGLAVHRMPATHNWCLGLALPQSRQAPPYLVEPVTPHRPIKVLHATGNATATADFMSSYSGSQASNYNSNSR